MAESQLKWPNQGPMDYCTKAYRVLDWPWSSPLSETLTFFPCLKSVQIHISSRALAQYLSAIDQWFAATTTPWPSTCQITCCIYYTCHPELNENYSVIMILLHCSHNYAEGLGKDFVIIKWYDGLTRLWFNYRTFHFDHKLLYPFTVQQITTIDFNIEWYMLL